MDLAVAVQLLNVLVSAGTLVSVLFAFVTYRQSVRTKRAEWLASLHEKFFETGRYTQLRRVLDYQPAEEYSALGSAVATGTHYPLADELYRYLNFFELLARLRELDQITNQEIDAMFDYDLRMIQRHDFILRDLKPQGFERLSQLLQSRLLRPTS